MKLPILHGDIIRLRPMDINVDKYTYYKVSLDEKMHTWTGNSIPETVEEIEELLKKYNEVFYVWMIELIESHEVIGMMRLSIPQIHNGSLTAGDSQRLHSAYWRKGHMKEARRLIYNYAYNELNIEVLVADALEENINSCKSLESVGYKKTDSLTEYSNKQNKQVIRNIYELRKEDWL